jgi:hypothetical protein
MHPIREFHACEPGFYLRTFDLPKRFRRTCGSDESQRRRKE